MIRCDRSSSAAVPADRRAPALEHADRYVRIVLPKDVAVVVVNELNAAVEAFT
jgi:hypothetical protein